MQKEEKKNRQQPPSLLLCCEPVCVLPAAAAAASACVVTCGGLRQEVAAFEGVCFSLMVEGGEAREGRKERKEAGGQTLVLHNESLLHYATVFWISGDGR